jgi:hypothetical protein
MGAKAVDIEQIFKRVLLTPEQKEVLMRMVEAARSLPKNKREKFALVEFGGEDELLHKGLSSDNTRVFGGDLEELGRKGFLTVSYGSRGTPSYDITPEGFAYYEYLKKSMGEPTERVENTIRSYLEAETFRAKYPQAYAKWSEAESMLWGSDSERQLSTIGHLLREAIQEFATALVDRYQPSNVDADKGHDKNRLIAVLKHLESRLGETEVDVLDALIRYWDKVSNLIQRQEHGGQRSKQALLWEDGRRAVFQTLVLIFEVDRSLAHLS